MRARTYSWLIIERSYSPQRMDLEVKVPRRTPNDWADIVVYEDDDCKRPYLIVENKEERANAKEQRQGIEQGFGNANSLRAPYMLFDWGRDSQFFDVLNFDPTERTANILGRRDALRPGYGKPDSFPLVANTATDIGPVIAGELERRVRRAHGLIWAGGKRDPLKSFDEWSKLLFAKIHDERNTTNGKPRSFQVGVGETATQVANRVRTLFETARLTDRTVFTEPTIDLPDDKIRDVVQTIQDVSLTAMSIDGLGHAFERFFGSIFRGGLGQYFTHRELARFMVAMVEPTDQDFILDPTCGSGGFLLEALLQVAHYIDTNYAGQAETERRGYDFAHGHLYGIEIHKILGRVCQTNLLLHKDGHTNIETDKSCLDSTFANPHIRPDGSQFTVILGNPPFGDKINEGDPDTLGSNSLSSFEMGRGAKQVKSELVILERAFEFLRPGGRMAMVIPDGVLNNAGEGSQCPTFRRLLLRTARIDAIVSLPDHAFRKSGAQNKTSILFATKFTDDELRSREAYYADALRESVEAGEAASDAELTEEMEASEAEDGVRVSKAALGEAHREAVALDAMLAAFDYPIFLAEVEEIGYSPSGVSIGHNDLYALDGELPDRGNLATVLGQYFDFRANPGAYGGVQTPECMAIGAHALFTAHSSYRMDPKYHLFERERLSSPPEGMKLVRLGDVLRRRQERVEPTKAPDDEFLVPTLTQEGELIPREAGGNNPLAWFGQYFTTGSRWFKLYEDDLVYSGIDLWKGCVTIVPPDYAGAIVSNEFPIYEVDRSQLDPHYLKLVLRSRYFRRALRALSTGHSNRRRIQTSDVQDLTIFAPEDVSMQTRVSDLIRSRVQTIATVQGEYRRLLIEIDRLIDGEIQPDELLATASGDVIVAELEVSAVAE